jgi:PAS domain S-box-containing protein
VIQSGHPKFIPAVPFTDYARNRRTMQVVKIPYVVSGADEQAVLGVAIDITDRMRNEEALRRSKVELESRVLQRTAELAASEERFRQLAENIEEVFWMSTPDKSQMLYASPAFETVFGRDLQSIYDNPLSFLDAIHPEDRDRVQESLSRQPYGAYSHEYRIVRPDGSLRWIWTRAFPVHNSQGEVYRVAGITQDITERKLAEERLFSEERTLRKLLAVQDRERKLLAYEIHDGFIQDVVGAQFMLNGLQQQAESEGRETSEMLTQASDALTKALAEGRRLIGELRPLVIDEQGIVEAINYLVHDQHSRGLEIHFEHDLSSKRLNPLLEGNLFRIVQEAVNNIARHSGAQSASISLRESDGLLRLEIRDAGKGFDHGAVPDDRFGLEGMIRRAELFGGHASVDSQPGEGTRVSVEMPIPKENRPNALLRRVAWRYDGWSAADLFRCFLIRRPTR